MGQLSGHLEKRNLIYLSFICILEKTTEIFKNNLKVGITGLSMS